MCCRPKTGRKSAEKPIGSLTGRFRGFAGRVKCALFSGDFTKYSAKKEKGLSHRVIGAEVLLYAGKLLLQDLFDDLSHATLLTASCDQIGSGLDFIYGVLHCDACPCLAYHADIIESVAKGHHLTAI